MTFKPRVALSQKPRNECILRRMEVKLQMMLIQLKGDLWDDLSIKQTGLGGGVSKR